MAHELILQFVLPTQDKADVDFLLKQIDRLGDAHAVAGRKLRSLRREVAQQAAASARRGGDLGASFTLKTNF